MHLARIKEQINSKISLAEVASHYLSLNKKGNKYWGLCPFHQEKSPSFSINADQNLFYCFGCQRGGDLFTFLMEIKNFSFKEALAVLAEQSGVELEQKGHGSQKRDSEKLLELYRRAAGSMNYFLLQSEKAESARQYLAERKVDSEMIALFNLGYAPAGGHWLHNFLTRKGYSDSFLKKSGLFSRDKYPFSLFNDRIIFPISNPTGEVIAFGGRVLQEKTPKYVNSGENQLFHKKKTLYGFFQAIEAIRKQGEAILVEGYFDVIAMRGAGLTNTVAPLGTAFTEEHAVLLRRFCRQVAVAFDGDSAGMAAAAKVIHIMAKHEINVRVIGFPAGSDPADILKKDDAKQLLFFIKNSNNSIDDILFLINREIKTQGGSMTTEKKQSIVGNLTPYLKSLPSRIKYDAAILQIAEALDIDSDSIRYDVDRSQVNYRTYAAQTSDKQVRETDVKTDTFRMTTEFYLMIALLAKPTLFQQVRTNIGIDSLEDKNARLLFAIFENAFRDDQLRQERLLAGLPDHLYGWVSPKLISGEFDKNPDSLVEELLEHIRRQKLVKRQHEIESRLKIITKTVNRRKFENDFDRNPAAGIMHDLDQESLRLLEEKQIVDAELTRN